MLNIELIQADTENVRNAIQRRGDTFSIDELVSLDNKRKLIQKELDNLRSDRKKSNQQIGLKKNPSKELIVEMKTLGQKVKKLEAEYKSTQQEIHTIMLTLPNIPRDNVPDGKDESSNQIVRTVQGSIKSIKSPAPYWEIAKRLGLIDLSASAKISGSRFYVLNSKAAKLQRSLISWMLNTHTEKHGYQELYLPYLVNSETVTGSGHLPKFSETMYHDQEDDLWLIPTAEVPITSMFRDEILNPDQIPSQFVSHTPCFRREKAAAGSQTRGIKRVHQFDKVEMYKFVSPLDSDEELLKLVANAEEIISQLELTYRVIELCAGDLGFSAVKTFDLEVWSPGSEDWLEVSSCSNCDDFQSRRAKIRYRPESGSKPIYPHTLNGSGLAIPRILIAIIENYQQSDGSIIIPKVLREYTGFDKID
ncbi:MAG: serine--tRNA ligase [SAR202 cluster bacterium]|nr:serine--tRNA ligase [SAR202 cluster bacterium]|tara:strand:- start:6013 stop:7272 length:1260 start_codon:yes stop_codon:yes gene_type:complete